MSSDSRVNLTEDESLDAELLADQLAESSIARSQAAAELVILRRLYSACKRDRARLPLNVRRVMDRFPAYSRTIEFHLAIAGDHLELEP